MTKPRPIPVRARALPGLLLALAFAVAQALLPARAFLVANGDFSAGTAPWALITSTSASATLSASGGEGRVNITAGGTSRSHVTLRQPLAGPLAAGVTYVITFDARADSPKPFDVLFRAATYTVLGGVYGLTAGPTPAPYVVEYTHLATDAADARLDFRLGANNTGITIDNVVVAPKGKISQLLTRDAAGRWVFPAVTLGDREWRANAYDFSYAGYRYGEREQPDGVPSAVVTLDVTPGENITKALNTAIQSLRATEGGTVLIPAGTYEIGAYKMDTPEAQRVVTIDHDNVFLRGAPGGATVLRVSADYHPPGGDTYNEGVITFSRDDSQGWHYSPNGTAATRPVEFGSREIEVENPGNFEVHDVIVIRQQMWRSFVEMYAFDPVTAPSRPWRWASYDAAGNVAFEHGKNSFTYRRRVLGKEGSVLRLDVPIPRRLDPADARVNVIRTHVALLRNCGLIDLTFTAVPEAGVTKAQDSLGSTLMIRGLLDGLFRNVNIASFRSIAFGTGFASHLSFIECRAADALNRGEGGRGYGFYIRGQNLLYLRCTAERLRHGYTTASPQTSNVVIKDCVSNDYTFNSDLPPGEYVDDTHLKYSHGLLWDGHRANEAGLLMVNRQRHSGNEAYETCGWAVVWNYRNEGNSPGFQGTPTKDYSRGHDCRETTLALTPQGFGLVIGAHAGSGPDGLIVRDGYKWLPTVPRMTTDKGRIVTNPALHVPAHSRVLYEHVGSPVAYSLYEALFASREPLCEP